MSNVKHPKCKLRTLASEAKARLCNNTYGEGQNAPKNITPQQREIYLKLCALKRSGEKVDNPIDCFADQKKMSTLSHDEKQRYILQICADYVSMRNILENADAHSAV